MTVRFHAIRRGNLDMSFMIHSSTGVVKQLFMRAKKVRYIGIASNVKKVK